MRAPDILVIVRRDGDSPTGTVAGGYPASLVTVGSPWPLPAAVVPGCTERDPRALAALIPATADLPAAPVAVLPCALADPDLLMLLVWCELPAADDAEVVVLARDGRFVAVSDAIEHVLGAPPAQWIGREVRDIVAPEDLADLAEHQRRLAAGESVKERIRAVAADGTIRWMHLHARPVLDKHHELEAVTATFRPAGATEAFALQQAADARREQRRADERYRRAMAGAAVGMCLIDPQGHFLEVNEALCRFFGYDAATLTGKSWPELTAPDHLESDLASVRAMLAGQLDSYRVTKQYLHADGRLIWGDLSASCVRDDTGAVENVLFQIVDITAAVESAERNRNLAQRLAHQTARLRGELRSAANYMSSILPTTLHGAVEVESRYLPSRELGGDSFDYTWVDADHLLVYLIDVSGHGIEPALLSVSLHNMLRSGSIAVQTLAAPDELLAELNRHFQMTQQNHHFFTMWCGVYQKSTRTLSYSSAGAPPALTFDRRPGGEVAVAELSALSAPVGMFEDTVFTSRTFTVPPGCRILVYSDGAYEIPLADGSQLTPVEFADLSTRLAGSADHSLDTLIRELRALTPAGVFEDDCSLIQLTFG